jgi:hypothetical protein
MMTSDHRKVHEWITKDYPTSESWKEIGREIYLASNGNCALARHRLADALRRSISKLQTGPTTYQRWNEDFSAIVTLEIESPGISTSNDAYVDWIRIADYLLLSAASTWPRLEDDNQRRKTMYDLSRRGFDARMIVKAVAEYLKENPQAKDADVRDALTAKGIEVGQIHISQAKKITRHTGGVEIVEQEPELPTQIERYKALYFKDAEVAATA